ncbi:hypothetical protein MF406_06250 [Georgenia sp. TF02-10]|uniref:DUF6912 family protein n=1 Tax=Georgenia sp. TF02-10 TaxID=2917725 RepID=UPI001FA7923B|nr:hypothetical protein [Georgenia sp. TF02-10]UNX55833.1 hypothetical protein MF406_06250 [Georgenia sp. TF02-10]
MRLYLPATTADLRAETLAPPWAHAVTAALRAALPEEDEEALEMVATLAAADDSVRLIAARGAAPRRLVAAAEVPASAVRADVARGPDQLPSVVELRAPVPWGWVVSLHLDEAAAAEDVAAAAAGDDDAFERAAERDLLWYDVTELAELRREVAG